VTIVKKRVAYFLAAYWRKRKWSIEERSESETGTEMGTGTGARSRKVKEG